METPVILQPVLGRSDAAGSLREIFGNSFRPDYPFEGEVSEGKGFLHQQVQIENYFVEVVLVRGAEQQFCWKSDTGAECLLVAMRGNWKIRAKQSHRLREAGLMWLAGVASLIRMCNEEEDGMMAIIRCAGGGGFEEMAHFTDDYVMQRLPENITRILQYTYFPADIAVHLSLVQAMLAGLELGLPTARNQFSAAERESIQNIRQYIDQHLYKPLSTEFLAAEHGVGTHWMVRGFRHLFGQTPSEYTRMQRMAQAKTQLETTRRTIKQIARDAGYRNVSNFGIAFKTRFGCTPGSVRQKNHKRL